MSDTLSAAVPRRESSRRTPYLYVGLRCDAPLDPPRRYALAGVEAVVLGRGTSVERTGDTLAIRLPDPRMSTTHARLTRLGKAWVIEDCNSKNGLFVGGAATARANLDDGVVFDIGQTSFVLAYDDDELPDGPAVEPAPGLATLVPGLAAAFDRLARAANRDVPIMIAGETGTGKELVARAIHACSTRAGRFVPVNCGALAPTLVEAELFGHKRGAFSGATEDRLGLVRSADGGTLFLDEIGELPAAAQTAMLRVLQEREVVPVGADAATPVDARLVTATHRDLERMAADGAFRGDLLARLEGVRIALPPLRERRADLALIVAALLARLEAPATLRFSVSAMRWLYAHAWPRNVRELERALDGALATIERDEIDASDLPSTAALTSPRALSVEDLALRERLAASVAQHGGNLSAVARDLGKDRTQIRRWMRRFGLERPE